MEDIEIQVALRNGANKKGELSGMREKRSIPGIVYGGGKAGNVLVAITEKALLDAIRSGGANAVLHLKHTGGVETVIVKELQRHVVTSALVHVDFQRVDLKKKIVVNVPVKLIGESPGVKLHGGVMEFSLRELKVEGLPGQIPQTIEVDISKLEVGDGIKCADISASGDSVIVEAGDRVIVHIMHQTVEAEPTPAEEGDAAAEPEVLKQKKVDEVVAEEDAKKGEAKKGDAKKGDEKKK